MNRIHKTVIAGMGALGLLFGRQIQLGAGTDSVCFLMDETRKQRCLKKTPSINGEPCSFRIITPAELTWKADLIMIATKYSGLREAAELIRPAVGENTTIISLLNGISSEEILAEYYGRGCIIDCVAIGMDAVREGLSLTYRNPGKLQVGITRENQRERLEELTEFLSRTGIPHEVCKDIRRAMWNKFMINVGINQTCMIYRCGYGPATAPGEALLNMTGAMREVIRIAAAEGVSLSEEDLEKDIKMLSSLNPDGYPSMRQDALAKRKSEVDLFAGTVTALGKKHGIDVPYNEKYLRLIREMEAGYGNGPGAVLSTVTQAIGE